jgi:hypothetical protein
MRPRGDRGHQADGHFVDLHHILDEVEELGRLFPTYLHLLWLCWHLLHHRNNDIVAAKGTVIEGAAQGKNRREVSWRTDLKLSG